MNKMPTIRGLIGIGLVFSFATAEGFQFWPTDAEWQSWPGYCKAKYVWTNIGKDSKFVSQVGAWEEAELARWENAGISGVHHYCAGSIYLRRARLEEDATRRTYILRDALDETRFTFTRSNKGSPLFSNVATQMASIMYDQGNFDDAVNLLREVIEAQPNSGVLYSAMAVMQRKLGKLHEAKETLLLGNKMLEGKSAEIIYNLGLISIELGEIDSAVEYAESAYELGFPLPGLRTRLEELGRM